MARYRWQFTISSFPQTISRAADIIALAENSAGKDRDTLLGCAMLLLAAALEQALATHLEMLSDFYRSTSNPPLLTNPAEDLRKSPFKTRLFRTPEISMHYPARLNPRSDYVHYLAELIDRRNKLMHFAEQPMIVDIDLGSEEMPKDVRVMWKSSQPTGVESVKDGVLTLNLNANDDDKARAGDPWGDITLAEARRSLAAVEMYTENVLSDPKPCEMLIPLEKRRPFDSRGDK